MRTHLPARDEKSLRGFELTLPATVANLGPGFDAIALALDLHLRISATAAASFSMSAEGRDPGVCCAPDNLVLTTYREMLESAGRRVTPLSLALHNEIPVGKGFGSSAAAIVAGVLLAVRAGGLRWSEDQILAEAARREKHADNCAACLHGGLVVVHGSREGAPQWVKAATAAPWPLLAAVPAETLPTSESRRVLPLTYDRADVVANLQNAMTLIAAFQHGRGELLESALRDRLHQPYRAKLCPLLPCLEPLAGTGGVLGVALCGAGPSVLMILDQAVQENVQLTVKERLRAHGLEAELISTRMESQGAQISEKHMASPVRT